MAEAVVIGAMRLAERALRHPLHAEPASSLPAGATVLVLQYALPLGYCVHNTPIYEAIKAQRPDLRIAVATHGIGYSTLRHNPFVDYLLQTPSPFADIQHCVPSLRQQLAALGLKPAVILTDTANPRTKVGTVALLAANSLRVGFTLVQPLFHRPLRYDWTRSLLDNNLRILEPIGMQATHYEPRVFFTHKELAAARELRAEVASPDMPTALFVTQGSGGQSTAWHRERFIEVIRHVHQVLGYRVLYVGTKADQAGIGELARDAGGIGHSIAGRTSIPELAAVLSLSDLMISIDTGTMHVGRAAGVPMVVLGPSWQKPLEWLPLQQEQARVLRGVDIDRAPAGYKLDEITAASVMGAADELTRQYPASEAAREARVDRLLSSTDHATDAQKIPGTRSA